MLIRKSPQQHCLQARISDNKTFNQSKLSVLMNGGIMWIPKGGPCSYYTTKRLDGKFRYSDLCGSRLSTWSSEEEEEEEVGLETAAATISLDQCRHRPSLNGKEGASVKVIDP